MSEYDPQQLCTPYLLHLYLPLISCQCKHEHLFPKNITSIKILVEEGEAYMYVVSTISLIKIHVLQVHEDLYMQEHMINDY